MLLVEYVVASVSYMHWVNLLHFSKPQTCSRILLIEGLLQVL
jgi:hypothetical protein